MFGYYTPTPEPPLHRWQGQSGKRYAFLIYPIDGVPSFVRDCNYIFARPLFGGTREPLYIGESGDFIEELKRHPKLTDALGRGATEIHIHFVAQGLSERLDIETDLRRRHWTPLNYQPTPALPFAQGLGALAALGIGGGNGLGLSAPPPHNALLGFQPTGFGGMPYATDLDWLLQKR
jgi:hypothetical protein